MIYKEIILVSETEARKPGFDVECLFPDGMRMGILRTQGNPPWTDAVLWTSDGHEVAVVCDDEARVLGMWEVEHNNNHYHLEIRLS